MKLLPCIGSKSIIALSLPESKDNLQVVDLGECTAGVVFPRPSATPTNAGLSVAHEAAYHWRPARPGFALKPGFLALSSPTWLSYNQREAGKTALARWKARGQAQQMLPHPLRIARISQETSKIKTFTLDGSLVAQPGQFVMVWLPRLNEKPFSVVNDEPLTLTVAEVGPFSARLHELKVGDRLWIRGPMGRGFNIAGQRPLLVGGGYGVAPLVFLASRASQVSHKVAVVGAATKDDLFFEARFAASGCEVVVVTEDCSAGEGGLCTDVVEVLLSEQHFDGVYACGPEAMLDRVEELCRQHGIPGQLSKEAYMRCGMGVCGSCQRDGLLVCSDGPVFDVKTETAESASQS